MAYTADQAPNFIYPVQNALELAIALLAAVLALAAFAHGTTQKAAGFTAIGTLPKGGWLALLGITGLISLLDAYGSMAAIFGQQGVGSFGLGLLVPLVGIGAAMIYLLDVRIGLRDLSGGRGLW